MKYKAAIFDLDGTLLDTLEDIAASMNRVLLKLGYKEHPLTNYRYYVGDGVRQLVQRALPKEFYADAAKIDYALDLFF